MVISLEFWGFEGKDQGAEHQMGKLRDRDIVSHVWGEFAVTWNGHSQVYELIPQCPYLKSASFFF